MTAEKQNLSKRRLLLSLDVTVVFLIIILLATAITFIILYATKDSLSPAEDLPKMPLPSISPLGKYRRAAVATDNVICSEIGRDALLNGANAVEAALAAMFCVSVMNAQSSGVGGGFFMTIYDAKSQKCTTVNARDQAPMAATADMFHNKVNSSLVGWKAIAVPGQIDGMWTAFTKFGSKRVKWASLIEPTIKLLDEGYPTSTSQAEALLLKRHYILPEPTMQQFINPKTSDVYKAGEIVTTRQKLADFYRLLANSTNPRDLFYINLAKSVFVPEIRNNGKEDSGILTEEDFANYKTLIHSTDDRVMHVKLRNGRVAFGPPPPAGAAVTLGILNIMDGYEHDTSTFEGNTEYYHRFIEASKFAFAQRSAMGDPDYASSNDSMAIARNLTSSEWAAEARRKITERTHNDDSYYGAKFEAANDHGTSSMTVIDTEGNAVSVTATINVKFGSIRASKHGFIWNDMMDDFSQPGNTNYFGFPASPSNFIEGGKRPMSSASPIIIIDKASGNVTQLMAIGSSGGSGIVSAVASVALRTLWLNSNIKEAIDWPRIHNQLEPKATEVEDGFPKEYRASLEARGQTFHDYTNFTVVTSVMMAPDQQIYANSDYRKGQESGCAGY